MSLNFSSLDEAMAAFEGYGQTGTVATRNNNPGDIISGPFATAHGATGSDNGFATFPTADAGFAAQDALVSLYAQKGSTIGDLLSHWSPANAPGNSSANLQNYIDYVTGKTGTTVDTPVSDTKNQPSQSTPGFWDKVIHDITTLGGITDASVANGGVPPDNSFSWGRTGAFLLGLIVIAAALYLFKPVQNIVNTTVKKGAKAASLAAFA